MSCCPLHKVQRTPASAIQVRAVCRCRYLARPVRPSSVTRSSHFVASGGLARMLVAAGRSACLREMLIIVSGLSIQDPQQPGSQS
jgi:hypothetical protein